MSVSYSGLNWWCSTIGRRTCDQQVVSSTPGVTWQSLPHEKSAEGRKYHTMQVSLPLCKSRLPHDKVAPAIKIPPESAIYNRSPSGLCPGLWSLPGRWYDHAVAVVHETIGITHDSDNSVSCYKETEVDRGWSNITSTWCQLQPYITDKHVTVTGQWTRWLLSRIAMGAASETRA